MVVDVYCCIPAYNEEDNIELCVSSLAKQKTNLNLETIICLNGCSDDTEKKTNMLKNRFPELNIRIIHSEKGKSYAQNAIVKNLSDKEKPLFFIDADVSLGIDCLNNLYEELAQTKNLIVVGAWPKPRKLENISSWQKFLFEVLHVRAFYPESEISINKVSKFKNYVLDNPQKSVSSDFESNSKIFFHGRAFLMRNSSYFKMPSEKNITDDTYLPNMIHTYFGPGTIRTRYDAEVYYKPYLSLKVHFKTYRRIFLDKIYFDKRFTEFKESRHYEQTRLNWSFIFAQKPKVIATFLVYSAIRSSENLMYKLLPKKEASELWDYERK